MKQNLYIFFLIIILITLCYLSLSKKNFTQIFEFFENSCPEGYMSKNGKCKQLCAGCKLSYCRHGVCGSPPNIFPI